jgi:ATP-binding cassette subfamily F protein 3
MAKNPNFLVLDEPTNHLDIPSREALEHALEEYQGTLLAVSHDRFFLDKVVDKIFALEGTNIRSYWGDYTYYENKKRELLEGEALPERPNSSKPKERAKQKTRRVNPIIVNRLKDEIERKEDKLQRIYDDLESSEYASDWDKLQQLDKQKNEIEQELLTLYEKLDNLISSYE